MTKNEFDLAERQWSYVRAFINSNGDEWVGKEVAIRIGNMSLSSLTLDDCAFLDKVACEIDMADYLCSNVQHWYTIEQWRKECLKFVDQRMECDEVNDKGKTVRYMTVFVNDYDENCARSKAKLDDSYILVDILPLSDEWQCPITHRNQLA